LRLAMSGEFAHPSGVHTSFSAGWHHVADVNHVEGVSEDRFVGTLNVRYVFNQAWPLRPAGIR